MPSKARSRQRRPWRCGVRAGRSNGVGEGSCGVDQSLEILYMIAIAASEMSEQAMKERYETTDGRYQKIGDDEWWDTTGINIVPDAVVDEYMKKNRVGIAVIKTEKITKH